LVENEKNLSHEGSCWIYHNARATNTSRVKDNAALCHNAVVTHSFVKDNATVTQNALIERGSVISDDVLIRGNAKIRTSEISGTAKIGSNVEIIGSTVSGSTDIYSASDDQILIKNSYIRSGYITKTPNIEDLLAYSLGVYPVNGKVRLYKRVNRDLSSGWYDRFFYPEKGIVEEKNYDPDPEQDCSSGLHFSTIDCYPLDFDQKIIAADIDVKDIICVLEGKVRCKKAKILGVVKG
jgi:NDP-sugar pyrophosphorylase family protein